MKKMNSYHIPVLSSEVINALKVGKGKKYIDATFGGGGHTKQILERDGLVLGIDADRDSIIHANEFFKQYIKYKTLILKQGNFSDIEKFAVDAGFSKVKGILFDLGLSSHQIYDEKRGFSYLNSSPLDMRMDQRLGVKASDLLNLLSKKELIEIFFKYGEEPKANKIAENIVERRKTKSFETNEDLVEVLLVAYGFKNDSDFARSKSCKRVFQALRIVVNNELERLEIVLPLALGLLEEGGRLVFITFHSLEDRIVKKGLKGFEERELGRIITKKPILPSEDEIINNSRSKSSKLRVFERN